MFVIEIALAMSVLDGAIANIALPTIAAELSAEPASAIWVVNAYQLAVMVSLLPFASLGELRGYRQVFGWGLGVFTLGSLACVLSDSLSALIASRILQGFGGAGIMSVNNALVRFVYPRDQLGRGVAINALVGATSAAVGPSVAAAILSVGPWQWLFVINVPLGGIALALIMGALPDTGRPSPFRLAQRPAECGDVRDADHRYRQSSSALYFCRAGAGGWRGRRCSFCLAPAAVAVPYAGRRAVRTTRLRAVCRHIGLLIHRPEPRLRLASFLL
jgi:MFS family permease